MITIDENFKIEGDTNQYTLVYRREHFDDAKEKIIVSTDRWYCTSIGRVFKLYMEACLRKNISSPSEHTLADLKSFIQSIEGKIDNSLKSIGNKQ